jgi:hypothetical protein
VSAFPAIEILSLVAVAIGLVRARSERGARDSPEGVMASHHDGALKADPKTSCQQVASEASAAGFPWVIGSSAH